MEKDRSAARDEIEKALLKNKRLLGLLVVDYSADPEGLTAPVDAPALEAQAQEQLRLLVEALTEELIDIYNKSQVYADVGGDVFSEVLGVFINGRDTPPPFMGLAQVLTSGIQDLALTAEGQTTPTAQREYYQLRQQKFLILRKIFGHLHKIVVDLKPSDPLIILNAKRSTSAATANLNAEINVKDEDFKTPEKNPEEKERELLDSIQKKLLTLRKTTQLAIGEIGSSILPTLNYSNPLNITEPTIVDVGVGGTFPKKSYKIYYATDNLITYATNPVYSNLEAVAAEDLKKAKLAGAGNEIQKVWQEEQKFYETLKKDIEALQTRLFDNDSRVVALKTAQAALTGKTFNGTVSYVAELAALKAATGVLDIADMPGVFEVRKKQLATVAENLDADVNLNEWIFNLPTTIPELNSLSTVVSGYNLAFPTTEDTLEDALDKISDDIVKTKSAIAGARLTTTQQDYVNRNFLNIATAMQERIKSAMPKQESGDLGEYNAAVRKFRRLSDEELGDVAIEKKLKFELHTFEMNQPYDKALYEAVRDRILLNWNDYLLKAQKEHFSPEKREKWLATRALVATGFWCRKFCDSPESPRSQVQNWKVLNDSENMFQLMSVKRAEMVYGTLGHPVIGKFLRELLHQTMVQASLADGLVAYRDMSGTDANGLGPDGLPKWFICDAANVPAGAPLGILKYDRNFNYASIQNDNGTTVKKYLADASGVLAQEYNLTPEYLKQALAIAHNMFAGFNFLDVVSAEGQNRYNTPLGPRSPMVSSIELATNIFGGVIHGLTRYGLDLSTRKPHAWYLTILGNPESEANPTVKSRDKSKFQFGQAGDVMAKGVQKMKDKLLSYYKIAMRTEVFERAGTTLADERAGATAVLGYLKPRGACRSHGMQNMFETFMPQGRDVFPDTNSEMKSDFGFDNYLLALRGWGQFLDKFLLPVAAHDLADLKKSKISGGVLASIIEDTLTFAKLVPGYHYDMVPIMLYDVVMRLVSGISDEKERIEALEWCGDALKGAFNDRPGEESALKPIKPHAQKLLAMFDHHNPANTYHGMDPSFKPQNSEQKLESFVQYLVLKWKQEQKGKPVPEIGLNYTVPLKVRIGASWFGLDEPTREFYKELEARKPHKPPYDRRKVDKADE